MPTKGSWVVEKEQIGNFIGKIASLKGNKAVINYWIANRTKRTVTSCKEYYRNDPKIERVKCMKKTKDILADLRHLQRDNTIERKTKAVKGTTSKKVVIMRNNKTNGKLKEIENMIWKDNKLEIKMNIQKYIENNKQKTSILYQTVQSRVI
ncbi:18707_t:CDS:2 [Gigaspora margarita]|uniref:18707_t:CDS:1 n=1 Tax=Gigaspora margarita TaxID=4874 RepID=A0ABN7WGM3_GIGMA|nr:18707_t:CDS:2 [Gigaspora margarita]